MNNYREIQNQWSIKDQINYPALFDWTVNKIEEGLDKGEKVAR